MSEHLERLRSVFAAALEQPPGVRAQWVRQRCGSDEVLQQEVLELLAAHDQEQQPFLTDGDIAAARKQLEQIVQSALVDSGDRTEWIPEAIGPYQVLGKLGEGGMGVVYEAQQEAPNRRVAVKLLHPMYATPARIKRFQQEVELLGRLHHPYIAQIYQAGVCDLGRGPQSYFAMELVCGQDLRSHCVSQGLSQDQKLALIAQVAEGVQHAHDKGIVHRDIKPDNVMVDEHGTPKILDFGVARQQSDASLLSTVITEEGQLIGTLAYMAPEQLRGSHTDASPLVDVYALGALAFEILAGRLPHAVSGLSVSAAIQLLTSTDAPLASKVLPSTRGDVEVILAKALESDPERRYASAQGLANDIRRHLDSLPILARPASRSYRIRKFVARNRGLSIGLSVAMLALLIGLIASLTFARREHAQSQRADEGQRLAQQNEARVVEVLLADAREKLEEGDYSKALEAIEWVREDQRGWGIRYLSLPLPQRLPISSDLPSYGEVVSSAPHPIWQVLDEEHLYGLDQERGCVVVHHVPTGSERELFRELPLRTIGHATATGWVLGRSEERAWALNLLTGECSREWPVEKLRYDALLRCEPGHLSDDGRVAAFRAQPGRLEIWDQTELVEVREAPPLTAFPGLPCDYSIRVSPDGRYVYNNRHTALEIYDSHTGAWQVHTPPQPHLRIFGEPHQEGWMGLLWGYPDRLAKVAYHANPSTPFDESSSWEWNWGGSWSPQHAEWLALAQGYGILCVDRYTGEPVIHHRYQRQDGFLPCHTSFWALGLPSPRGEFALIQRMGDAPLWLSLDPRWAPSQEDPRVRTYREHEALHYYFAVSRDGSLIASSGVTETTIRVWDTRTLETLATLERGYEEPASRAALMGFSEDDCRLIMTTPMPGREGAGIVEWDLTTGATRLTWPEQPVKTGIHYDLLDPYLDKVQPGPRARIDRRAVYLGEQARVLWLPYEDWLWKTKAEERSGRRWSTLPEPDLDLRIESVGLAAHPTEPKLAIVSSERAAIGALAPGGLLTIRDANTGEPIHQRTLARVPGSVDWSPDGARIAVGSMDGTVVVLNPTHLTIEHEIRAHSSNIQGIAWMPDNERLVTISGDHTIKIFDARPLRARDALLHEWQTLLNQFSEEEDIEGAFGASEGLRRSAARAVWIRRAHRSKQE